MSTRITAGKLKGRTLRAPRGLEVRPTPAKVREALFSILADRLRDANVLDLYSGCGSLGIEALSRGAARATFVDGHRAALTSLNRNLASLELQERARISRRELPGGLDPSLGGPFDLVFSDPPYAINPLESLGRRLAEMVADDAVWSHELSGQRVRNEEPPKLPGWAVYRVRRYGDVGLWIYERAR